MNTTKSSTRIIELIRICSGKLHAWYRAEIIEGKDKGKIIEIRKPIPKA